MSDRSRRKPARESGVISGAAAISTGQASDAKRSLYHCNNCHKDISSVARVKCAECQDFDLCLECFSVGVELYPHRNNHNYRVVDDLSFPILHPEWGADEEVLLLEAIDISGLGNWEGVAELLGGNKGAAQCKQHYYDMYINVASFPLPTPAPELANLSIQELKTGTLVPSSASTHIAKRHSSALNDPHHAKIKSAKIEADADAGAAGTSQKEKKPKLEESQVKGEAQQVPPPLPTNELSHRVGKMGYDPEGSGYHFRRREFDPEWDNDAEATIADMEFNDFDTEEDRRLKLRTLEIYNRRMDERERRRDILLAHNLIKVKRDQAQEKRLNPQERELMARLRVFARYEDVSECSHEEFAEGVLVEHRLRARIKELQEQRRNGIRTLAQGDAFEAERKRSAEEDPAVASGVNPGPKSLAHSLTAFRAQRGLPLDLTSLPGVEHLTRKEREHCAMHRLLPAHYLGLKDIALRDAQKNGAITKQEAKSSFRLDPGKSLKLFEFWASMGWIEFATNE